MTGEAVQVAGRAPPRHAHIALPVADGWMLAGSVLLVLLARHWFKTGRGSPIMLGFQFLSGVIASVLFLSDLRDHVTYIQSAATVALLPGMVSCVFNLVLSRLPA